MKKLSNGCAQKTLETMLDTEQGFENYRFLPGMTNGEVFHRLNEGEYLYGTSLQGQDFKFAEKSRQIKLPLSYR